MSSANASTVTTPTALDLGNNESLFAGVIPQADGSFLALTFTASRTFKTRAGADRWFARRSPVTVSTVRSLTRYTVHAFNHATRLPVELIVDGYGTARGTVKELRARGYVTVYFRKVRAGVAS